MDRAQQQQPTNPTHQYMRLATYSQRRRLKHRERRPRLGSETSSSREYSCSLPRAALQTQRITDFFKNAHDFEIYGGQFTLVNSSVDSKALNNIRQDVRHIKIIVVVLFASAGHLRT